MVDWWLSGCVACLIALQLNGFNIMSDQHLICLSKKLPDCSLVSIFARNDFPTRKISIEYFSIVARPVS
jgi:hypothetical protein